MAKAVWKSGFARLRNGKRVCPKSVKLSRALFHNKRMTKQSLLIVTTALFSIIASTLIFIFSPKLLHDSPLPLKLPIAENKNEIEIILVGDIMLSRSVGTKMSESEDWALPFRKLGNLLRSVDLTFGNLESPFLNTGDRVTEGLSFKTEPQAVEGLALAGFDILSTANNHAFDQGKEGVEFTKSWLAQNGMLGIGTGSTTQETHAPAIFTVNEKKIGFLAYTYFKRRPYIADLDIDQMQKDVASLKDKAEFIIVSMHAGTEYVAMPTQEQKDFAHAAIDAGADVVVGHHPHWVQPIERYATLSPSPLRGEGASAESGSGEGGTGSSNYHTGIIFYSLGNFVFDQEWSQKTKEGLTVRLTIKDNQLTKVELVPVIIENYCCPRLADESESKKILDNINETSTIIILK